MIPFIHSGDVLTAYINNRPNTITRNHQHFQTILDKFLANDFEGIEALIASPETRVNALVSAMGASEDLYIRNGEAFYKGAPLHNELGRMLVHQLDNDYSIPGFVNFAKKVCESPYKTSVDELYLFLRDSQMPICEDGDFLAYKKVRYNFHDIWTGTYDNSPGNRHSMPRFAVDGDRNNPCSTGFHFCSYTYLTKYRRSRDKGSRVVVLKINPVDVVSIPDDYQNGKGRCCAYESLTELEDWRETPALLEGSNAKDWVPEAYYDDGTADSWCDECDILFRNCPCED